MKGRFRTGQKVRTVIRTNAEAAKTCLRRCVLALNGLGLVMAQGRPKSDCCGALKDLRRLETPDSRRKTRLGNQEGAVELLGAVGGVVVFGGAAGHGADGLGG